MTIVKVNFREKNYNELIYWLHANIKHHWRVTSSAFIFTDSKDAMLFSLKWL